MTVLLCALAFVSPPCSGRGGHSVVVPPPRGGESLLAAPPVRERPRFAAFVCIHRHEAAWDDAGDPYWGGLQFDKTFMATYGADVMIRHRGEGAGGLGLADSWTPAEQIEVAMRAYDSGRGFGPWPNTARDCGLSTTPVAV